MDPKPMALAGLGPSFRQRVGTMGHTIGLKFMVQVGMGTLMPYITPLPLDLCPIPKNKSRTLRDRNHSRSPTSRFQAVEDSLMHP